MWHLVSLDHIGNPKSQMPIFDPQNRIFILTRDSEGSVCTLELGDQMACPACSAGPSPVRPAHQTPSCIFQK